MCLILWDQKVTMATVAGRVGTTYPKIGWNGWHQSAGLIGVEHVLLFPQSEALRIFQKEAEKLNTSLGDLPMNTNKHTII